VITHAVLEASLTVALHRNETPGGGLLHPLAGSINDHYSFHDLQVRRSS
jgi:hypothetical protein